MTITPAFSYPKNCLPKCRPPVACWASITPSQLRPRGAWLEFRRLPIAVYPLKVNWQKPGMHFKRYPARTSGCKLVTAPVKGRRTFICFDEDTTVKNVKQALAMGFDATELIKRFTAAGTGPGQGGIPGHNLPLFVAQYYGGANGAAKPTTVRVPLVPAYIATYAGNNHDMCKRTPVHASQEAAGGVVRRIGVWKRARYFSRGFQLSCRNRKCSSKCRNAGCFHAGQIQDLGAGCLEGLAAGICQRHVQGLGRKDSDIRPCVTMTDVF